MKLKVELEVSDQISTLSFRSRKNFSSWKVICYLPFISSNHKTNGKISHLPLIHTFIQLTVKMSSRLSRCTQRADWSREGFVYKQRETAFPRFPGHFQIWNIAERWLVGGPGMILTRQGHGIKQKYWKLLNVQVNVFKFYFWSHIVNTNLHS